MDEGRCVIEQLMTMNHNKDILQEDVEQEEGGGGGAVVQRHGGGEGVLQTENVWKVSY